MANNMDIPEEQDREPVAGSEDYEIKYLSEKLNVPAEEVKKAIAKVGNSRNEVEAFLKTKGHG